MARLSSLMAVVAAVAAGCSANTATQEREEGRANPPLQRDAVVEATAAVAVPDNPADRSIRRALTLAIERDTSLQQRAIRFIVANGDVNVTGIVQTEEERRKINELAMSIDGVKSVANAVRVAE